MTIYFVTGNIHKFAEVQLILGGLVSQVNIDLPEIQAVDPNVVIKAKLGTAFEELKQPVLVEDTSLSFSALNGLPGALIKWFLMQLGNDGLCKLLDGFESRRATAVTWLGYFDGANTHFFSGTVEGQIVEMPRGTNGFGWDAIFQPNGSSRTFAELSDVEKSDYSMRKTAVLKLKEHLT